MVFGFSSLRLRNQEISTTESIVLIGSFNWRSYRLNFELKFNIQLDVLRQRGWDRMYTTMYWILLMTSWKIILNAKWCCWWFEIEYACLWPRSSCLEWKIFAAALWWLIRVETSTLLYISAPTYLRISLLHYYGVTSTCCFCKSE